MDSTDVLTPVKANESTARAFDGIVCFGGVDWWYHNRGHFDIQMMREFSARFPVVYVNSIGMRVPSLKEGTVLLARVARKLRSLQRGLTRIRDNFFVLSPLLLPGRIGRGVSDPLLSIQIRGAARRAGIGSPLVWAALPTCADLIPRLAPMGVVYQRTDRYEEYPGVDAASISEFDQRLKKDADLTIYCSSHLLDEEAGQCRQALFVDHGVDFAAFEKAGKEPFPEPEDMRGIPRPRVGFVGGIDRHTFDVDLFKRVAGELSEVRFVLVGSCQLPPGWCALPNVALLGQIPYEQVAAYMAACDVLIMPWNQNRWIEACNPVKLKEYLAVGRPVVTTPFPELGRYEGATHIAERAESFARAIREALAAPEPPEFLRERVRNETWTSKADSVLAQLSELGLVFTRAALDLHGGPRSVVATRTRHADD